MLNRCPKVILNLIFNFLIHNDKYKLINKQIIADNFYSNKINICRYSFSNVVHYYNVFVYYSKQCIHINVNNVRLTFKINQIDYDKIILQKYMLKIIENDVNKFIVKYCL